jgi:hypothetical protein
MAENNVNIPQELAEADARLPVNLGDYQMPLDMAIRSIALTIAQRHMGDKTVHDGALYNALKMDNKLGGPLTVDDVLRAALIFEAYMWGKWSRDIAGKAMEQTLHELNAAIEGGALDKHIDGVIDEPPTRPHGGAGNPDT